MADGEKKSGRQKYKKCEYLENEKMKTFEMK